MTIIKTDTEIIYRADDNKVFDWKDSTNHKLIDEDGNEFDDHLKVKEIRFDIIDNYVEVDEVL